MRFESPFFCTRRKLQTPGTAEEHKRKKTSTMKPSDRQPAELTDQAPGTVERAGKTHNTNQHSSRARLHHSDHPPSLSTPNMVITRSSQLMQPAAKHRWAEPHCNTDTTRLSGDTQRPPAWGAHYQEQLMDCEGRTASLWGGGRGGD